MELSQLIIEIRYGGRQFEKLEEILIRLFEQVIFGVWLKKVFKVCFKHWTSLTVVCYNDGDRSMGIFLFDCLKIGRSFLYLYFSFSIGEKGRGTVPQVVAMMNKEMLYYSNPEHETPEELKALLI